MKKLRLDLADLRVEGFEPTVPTVRVSGTVHAASNPTQYAPAPGGCTFYPNTCDLLCFGSWHDTDCC
jgi:hypothetical protein